MKTIKTFGSAILILLSMSTFVAHADSKPAEDHPRHLVAHAPTVWGNPDELAPLELGFVKAKYAKVPLAPFVWGKPLDKTEIQSFINLKVPVAPFVLGSPDKELPEITENQAVL